MKKQRDNLRFPRFAAMDGRRECTRRLLRNLHFFFFFFTQHRAEVDSLRGKSAFMSVYSSLKPSSYFAFLRKNEKVTGMVNIRVCWFGKLDETRARVVPAIRFCISYFYNISAVK